MAIKALVGCQNDACATEVSYELDMVRKYNGRPICQVCYEEMAERDESGLYILAWDKLCRVTLADLSE